MKGHHLVREARRRAGISQAELAARAGTTQSAIARLEGGRSGPSWESVMQLVQACGFDIEVGLVPARHHDWSLIETNLRLSPSERVERLVNAVSFVEAGRRAIEAAKRG